MSLFFKLASFKGSLHFFAAAAQKPLYIGSDSKSAIFHNKAGKAPAAQKSALSNFQVPGVGLFLLRSQLKKLKPDGSGWVR